MRSVFFLFFLGFLIAEISAQTIISGTVQLAGGERLPGANVQITGSYDGATTDTAGYFSFKTDAQGSQQLLVLFMGCDSLLQTVNCAGTPLHLPFVLREKQAALREVVVSAGTFEATSDRRRAAVLSALDIALTASASADIAGAITMLPGTTRNGESGQILVRGGAAYETRTFMDGMLIQNPYNSTVGNLPARNRFSPFLFKGTIFSTGGYSAEYGQAMSSALILNTTDLAPKTTTGITLLSVGSGLAHTHRWKNTSLSVSGAYNNLRPYFYLVPQRVDWIKAPQSGESEIVFRYKTSENGGMLKFYANINRSAMDMNAPIGTDDLSPKRMRLDAQNVYANLTYRDMLGKQWLLFAGAAYTRNKDDIKSIFDNTKNHQSAQGRFVLSRSLNPTFSLKCGAEFYKSLYDETYRAQTNARFNTLLRENFSAVFAETDIFFSKRLVSRVGARVEHSALLKQANLAPRVSLAWITGPKAQVSMAFGRFYQTPEYDQMRLQTNLRFEEATHWMLNYQCMRNGYVFRVETYRKWYDNLLKTNAVTGIPEHSGGGYAQGLDLFFRDNKHIKNGDYWVSYSYLDTKRNWRNFPVTATPNFAMKHSVSVAFKQFFPKYNTALSASYAFNSGRPYQDPNLETAYFNTSRTPAYHDLSMAVTYLTNICGHFTIFYVSIQNVAGLKQVFGYQYGTAPDASGRYQGRAVTPPAKRFGVVAIIMSIGERYKKETTTTNDF